MLGDSRIVEKRLEQRFVISFQRDEVGWKRIACEAIEHTARVWAPIHVIAESDGHTIADWVDGEVTRDLNGHPVEKIRAAMNVADDIKSSPIEDDRLRSYDHRSPEGCVVY